MISKNTSISTHDLHCQFGEVHAVDGITFEVQTGTLFGFLGPNGAGKTTTIRLLLGLLEASSGSAEVWDLIPAPRRIRFA